MIVRQGRVSAVADECTIHVVLVEEDDHHAHRIRVRLRLRRPHAAAADVGPSPALAIDEPVVDCVVALAVCEHPLEILFGTPLVRRAVRRVRRTQLAAAWRP
jgi:hypothetical protein